MKQSKTKEVLFITGNLLSKVTGILAGTTVVAFLVGLGVNIALDGIERKERRNFKK